MKIEATPYDFYKFCKNFEDGKDNLNDAVLNWFKEKELSETRLDKFKKMKRDSWTVATVFNLIKTSKPLFKEDGTLNLSKKERKILDTVYALNMYKINDNVILFLVPSIEIERKLRLIFGITEHIIGLSLYRDDTNDFWKTGILLKSHGEMCYLGKDEFLYNTLFNRANDMYDMQGEEI